MLSLTVNVKETSFAVVSMIADSQLRMRDIEGFWTTSLPYTHPPKKNSLDRKPLKRTLNLTFMETETDGNCAEDREVFSLDSFCSFLKFHKGASL